MDNKKYLDRANQALNLINLAGKDLMDEETSNGPMMGKAIAATQAIRAFRDLFLPEKPAAPKK